MAESVIKFTPRQYDSPMQGTSRDIVKLSLAESGLPSRVRDIAARLLLVAEAELGDRIRLMLVQLENQLFAQADKARSPADQSVLLRSVQTIKLHRDAFPPAYFAALESRLATLRRPPPRKPVNTGGKLLSPSSEWRLSESIPEEDLNAAQLQDLAMPLEAASSLPLYLLGQRFGVLAGAPAFAAEQIVLGPRTLVELAGKVSVALFGNHVPALMLQSHFAQQALGDYPRFVEHVNHVLDEAGVLPGLSYVPVRPTRASRTRAPEAKADAPAATEPPEAPPAADTPPVPADTPPANAAGTPPAATSHAPAAAHRGSHGPMQGGTPANDESGDWFEQPEIQRPLTQAPPPDFRYLQQLLTAQRIAGRMPARPAMPPGVPLERTEVDRFLDEFQADPPSDASSTRSLHGLREDLLQRARAEHGPQAELPREDADTFEVLSILYAEVAREVRAGSSVHGLLERLQLPILRLALRDRGFFDEATHPGRQILNTIAESDATAYGDHGVDPYFEAAMHRAVERIEDDYHGEREVLREVNEELQSQFRQQIKRSQASEKRLVEAAHGRERMAVAKNSAGAALQDLITEYKPVRAIEALLRRAWLDAMTLVALRNGEESAAWRDMLGTTRKILETVNAPGEVQAPELATEIDTAMRRVGYHETESGAIAAHLSRSHSAPRREEELTATEVTARIKAHARFGRDDEAERAEAKAERAKPSRNAQEEECYQHLRTLPFGCWVDFVQNQQGNAERLRLSWYSTITDKALFVNRRGQRAAEMQMDTLARLMAQGQLKVVERTQLRLFDRAFRSTMELLRSTLRGGRSEDDSAPQAT